MKKKVEFILLIIMLIFIVGFVSTASIGDNLHLNIQVINSSGDVVTGTFKFEFNISTSEDCSNVVYSNFTNLTTDPRGIISYYLENTNLNYSDQYWLCYYRDGTLINASKIAQTPYSFTAKNVSAEGVLNDSNLDLSGKNVTASTGFFSFLGDLESRITTFFVQDINFTGAISGTGNIGTTGNVNADWFFGNHFNSSGTSYFGDVDFNNGFNGGNGVSITGGAIWAKTIYVYNLSSVNINNLNINGSLLPYAGWDNQFNIGSAGLRWKDLFLGGQLYSNGTGDNYFLGNLGIGTITPQNKLNVIGDGNFTGNLYAGIVYSGGNEVLTSYTETDPLWSGNSTLVPYLSSSNTFTANNIFNQNLTVGTNTLHVDSTNHRVGIGTSSPAYNLEVNGTMNVSTSNVELIINKSGVNILI